MSSTVSAKETLESSLKSAHEKSNDYQIQIESLEKDLDLSQDELRKFTEKSEHLQNLTVELQDQLKAKEDEHDKALDKLEELLSLKTNECESSQKELNQMTKVYIVIFNTAGQKI